MEIFDMQPEEFYVERKEINSDNNSITYHLIPIKEEKTSCGNCGSFNVIQNGKYDRKIRDLPSFNRQVGLVVHSHRYRCKDCGASWVNQYKTIDDEARLTKRLIDYIKNESIKRPFKQVGEEVSLTDTTVIKIFKKHEEDLSEAYELYAPEVLGIDENHLMGHYRAVFSDVKERKLIEILANRAKKDIKKFIKSLPNYHIEIKVVTMDMWRPYKEAVYETIPDSVIVIDKFHVIKEINKTLNGIRIALKETVSASDRKYLKNNRWLMLKDEEDLTSDQKRKLNEMFERFPEFSRPYYTKELLRKIYAQPDRISAEELYSNIKDSVREYDDLGDFEEVFSMIDNWHTEIFNYFDYQYTNAVTEYINRKINSIADAGRGYSFKVLRAKAIYEQYAQGPTKFEFNK